MEPMALRSIRSLWGLLPDRVFLGKDFDFFLVGIVPFLHTALHECFWLVLIISHFFGPFSALSKIKNPAWERAGFFVLLGIASHGTNAFIDISTPKARVSACGLNAGASRGHNPRLGKGWGW